MQLGNPKLSILIPAYNAEKYIGDSIKSVLLQTFWDIEILVCDDCSTDNTFLIINSFAKNGIRIFRNDTNIGKNKTTEFLLKHARGEYVSVHDADDISLPDRFYKQIKFLVEHPGYALCGSNFISFLDNRKIIDKSDLECRSEIIRKEIQKGSQFHGPTIVFKKSILPEVGGLYRYFTRAEDIDFTMRVCEKFDVANLPEHLYLYRHVHTSLTNNLSGYNIERLGHAKLLYFLAKERRENNGIDTISKGDFCRLEKLMEEFIAEYNADPTIALRRGVFRLLGMKMFANALNLAWKALFTDFNMLNLKCLVYAIGASLLGRLKLLFIHDKIDLTFLNEYSEKDTSYSV